MKGEEVMIIVIGGSSFIGVYTVKQLVEAGYEVLATGRNAKFDAYYKAQNIPYINFDLTVKSDFNKLPKENVEGVILLSGLLPANATVNINVDENAEDYIKVNTLGTINVLEFCRRNNIRRLISTTSYAEVLNALKKDVPITEDEPKDFLHRDDHAAYVISKIAASELMEYYNQQHGMKNAIFRLPPVYGVGPHGGLYINGTYKKSGLQIFIEKSMAGEDIQVFGDKDVSRDVVYVKDVADAFVKAIRSENTYGLYNITSGRSVSLAEQARAVAKVFACDGKESKVVYKPEMQNNSLSYVFDISKANRDFVYKPQYADFEVMMKDYKKEMERDVFGKLFE